jgi:hypothetical protein
VAAQAASGEDAAELSDIDIGASILHMDLNFLYKPSFNNHISILKMAFIYFCI